MLASCPINEGPNSFITLLTAFNTPFPLYLLLSPSLNSKASNSPVDAPEGTADMPVWPAAEISTSTVGKPLESKISRA